MTVESLVQGFKRNVESFFANHFAYFRYPFVEKNAKFFAYFIFISQNFAKSLRCTSKKLHKVESGRKLFNCSSLEITMTVPLTMFVFSKNPDLKNVHIDPADIIQSLRTENMKKGTGFRGIV